MLERGPGSVNHQSWFGRCPGARCQVPGSFLLSVFSNVFSDASYCSCLLSFSSSRASYVILLFVVFPLSSFLPSQSLIWRGPSGCWKAILVWYAIKFGWPGAGCAVLGALLFPGDCSCFYCSLFRIAFCLCFPIASHYCFRIAFCLYRHCELSYALCFTPRWGWLLRIPSKC